MSKVTFKIEMADDDNLDVEVSGARGALIAMLTVAMFRDPSVKEIMEEAIDVLHREQGNLDLLMQEEDEGVNTMEEFSVFWAKVEDRARSVKHFFKSDYYKYKDAIEELAREKGTANWLIDKALYRIRNYSNEAGD